MNNLVLIGRLTKDAEVRYSQNGDAWATFRLAADRGKDATDFIPCKAFKKTAEFLEKYGTKGTKFALEGSVRVEQWESDGQKHERMIVVANRMEFVESKGSKPQSEPEPQKEQQKEPDEDGFVDGIDEELPFM